MSKLHRANKIISMAYLAHQISHSVVRRLNRELHPHGLTYSLLVLLAAVDHLEHASQMDLAMFLNHAPASIKRQIEILLQKRWVERVESSSHTGWSVIVISSSGERILTNMLTVAEGCLAPALGRTQVTNATITSLRVINRTLAEHDLPSHLL